MRRSFSSSYSISLNLAVTLEAKQVTLIVISEIWTMILMNDALKGKFVRED